MKTITILTFTASLAAPFVAAAPAPAPTNTSDPGPVIQTFPNGLPHGLYPGSGLASRAPGLEKRQDPTVVVDAPGVDFQTFETAGVFVCGDPNFRGLCRYIRSIPGQCVNIPAVSNPLDLPTALGPENPWECTFFVGGDCDPDARSIVLGWPGSSDLRIQDFDDVAGSYICVDPGVPVVISPLE